MPAAELEDEIRFADIYGLFTACSLLPIVLANPKNPPKLSEKKNVLESLDPNVNTFVRLYYGDNFKDVIINQLEMLEAKGIFS